MNINRLIAFVIDFVIASAFFKTINSVIPLEFAIYEYNFFGAEIKLSFSLLIVMFFLYLLIFDIINNGKTIGKMIMNLTVTNEKKGKVSIKALIVRSLFKLISLLIFPVSLLLFFIKNKFIFQDNFTELTVKTKH